MRTSARASNALSLSVPVSLRPGSSITPVAPEFQAHARKVVPTTVARLPHLPTSESGKKNIIATNSNIHEEFKELLKSKDISEDQERKSQELVQKITNS